MTIKASQLRTSNSVKAICSLLTFFFNFFNKSSSLLLRFCLIIVHHFVIWFNVSDRKGEKNKREIWSKMNYSIRKSKTEDNWIHEIELIKDFSSLWPSKRITLSLNSTYSINETHLLLIRICMMRKKW